MTRFRAEESLTDAERAAMRRRLGPEGERMGEAATVRDVAEAAGLPEGDVATHLRQIRAEGAFSAPAEARPSALPWIAGGALLVAFGVTAWRLRPQDPLAPLRPDPKLAAPTSPFSPQATVSTTVRTVEAAPMLPAYTDVLNATDGMPDGFRVEAIGQGSERMGSGDHGPVHAQPYDTVLRNLSSVSERLIERLVEEEAKGVAQGGPPIPAGNRFRDMTGAVFSPRPGFVRLSIDGWAGGGVAWVAVPLTGAGRKAARELAVSVLADAKAEQDAALASVADATQGLVSPPPGFSVRYAGRRLDFQSGPRVSFAGVPLAVVARRLEAALLNAVHRDRRPPLGPWSGNAAAEAKIPVSKEGRFEIIGPDDVVAADVPTDPADPAATARAVRELAERTARQWESIEKKALGIDADARP